MTMSQRDFGWKFDLPHPLTPPDLDDSVAKAFPPPTIFNEDFLEIPLSRITLRGIFGILGCVIILICTAASVFLAVYFFTSPKVDHESLTHLALFWLAAFYLLAPHIRLDFMLPRNEPIRFNRHRQKVYFYHYRFDRLRPLGRKGWGVKPVAYDWKYITAEFYRVYLPMGYGGVVEKVMLSVRKPGTDEVIDRLPFADSLEKGEQYWAIARQFMQNGPEELPAFRYAPLDPDTDDHPNPFLRLAPKVKWPTDMDLESRTAPSSEEKSCDL